MNEIMNKMLTFYHEKAYTNNYIFGFAKNGNIYACFTDASVMDSVCTLDKASAKNGGGYSLRCFISADMKKRMVAYSEVICSESEFKAICNSNKYNKGENFERIIANRYGLEWHKDNLKFTEGPDMTINGVDYQLKFEKATFVTETFVNAY